MKSVKFEINFLVKLLSPNERFAYTFIISYSTDPHNSNAVYMTKVRMV